MIPWRPTSPPAEPSEKRVGRKPPASEPEPARRFTRSDGRFDLPVIVGRTPKQVARRLA
jgi:hypothetical protein